MLSNYTPRKVITLICVLCGFLGTGLVYAMPGPFYSKFAEIDRHISKPIVGFTVSSFNLAGIVVSAVLLVFPQPRLAKLFFILGTSLEGVGMVFFGLAFWVEDKVGFEVACVIARVMPGLGNSFLWASGPVLLCQVLPERRAQSAVWITMSYNLGYSLGPVIGGFFYNRFGYPGPFIFVGLHQITVVGIFLLCMRRVEFEIGSITHKQTSPQPLCKHLKLFKSKICLLPLAYFWATARATLTQVSLAPYLYTTYGLSTDDIVLYYYTPDAVCKLIGCLVFGVFSYKGYFELIYGINSILLGFPILALSIPSIWDALECATYIGAMVVFGGVPTIAIATSFVLLMSKVLVDVSNADLETSLFLAGALFTTTGHVGFVFGPIVISGLLEAFLGFYIAYAILGFLVIVCGCVVLKILLDLKMFNILLTEGGKTTGDQTTEILPTN